jgi:hypothetical protein
MCVTDFLILSEVTLWLRMNLWTHVCAVCVGVGVRVPCCPCVLGLACVQAQSNS